ncbi:MAG TPA: extracellular solute-binding protein [Candidatus Udaeobacter sp.]|nr:extracellular solute-binding protein [Candidatus Udaeobacter sp.]
MPRAARHPRPRPHPPSPVLVGLVLAAAGLGLGVEGCGKSKPENGDAPKSVETTTAASANLTIPNCPCAFDPAAGDPSVPAEMGGPGFTGEGWQTASQVQAMGRLDAPKGGMATQVFYDWPATLRQAGTGWNDYFNYMVASMSYESLLQVHPVTLEFMPMLATHWQISDDKMTYRFRINPKARWSDGREVTAEDVVATIKLKTDPGIQDPSAMITFSKMEKPRAISKYIVEVKAKEMNWRNFLYFAGTSIFPAHEIGVIDGKTYLDKYQFKYTAVSGAYEVRPEDIVKGVSITLTRRTDYWGKDECFSRGLWNLDQVKFVVVKDDNLAFEKLKKGEIDIFQVPKAQWWAEEVDKIDGVQRGLIQKRKVFTDAPIGIAGIAVNTRRPPLDDLRLRKALCHLLNRELMIEKLYFNEYSLTYSYYQGGIYQNPNNKPLLYDPDKAVTLLAEAGWTQRDPEGYLVKNGKRLEFSIQYETQLSERSLTIFQEDCQRAGIKINLELVNRSTRWKNLMDRKYELTSTNWGALVFPNPESSFSSKLADKNDNNNITGYKNPQVDSLCTLYDRSFDVQDRIRLIQAIDGLVYEQHPYILEWYLPSQRFLYWNKFGQPDWYIARTGDYDTVLFSWWVDPERDKTVLAGKSDPKVTMPKGETEVHFWEAYKRQVESATAAD